MEGILFPRAVPEGREGLKEYRARGGYEALAQAITGDPGELIKIVSDAGLRGRGGAGFPTGKKWQLTREAAETPRYLVVNGGEDEPGSKKDRVLLENVPHLVIEGTILSAYAIGANQAYLYINAQYDTGIKSITDALAEAKTATYWGEKVLGSDFNLAIEIFPAPHNYVAGEDTAALEVIEGRKPQPRQKPPFPVTVGLFGKPTSVNNVETLANVAPILLKGAQWYRQFGTAESPGTMIFSLNDDVNRPGVYELPFGTPLRYLIEDCGGGLKSGKPIKAIMPAAPSSAFLPPDKIDTPLDHNAMREAGADRKIARLMASPYALNPDPQHAGPDVQDQKGPRYHAVAKSWTAPFVMAAINTRVVRRSHALADFPYGRAFRYAEAVMTGSGPGGWLKALSVSGAMGALLAAASFKAARTQLERFVLPAPGEGPDAEARARGYFELHQLGVFDNNSVFATRVTGDRDPGYGSTSKMIAECAVCLALDELTVGGGFWTPATALAPALLPRLTDRAGLTFDVVSS